MTDHTDTDIDTGIEPGNGRHARYTNPATEAVLARYEEQATRAWEMRVAGLPWKTVAEQAGYTDASNCRRAVVSRYGSLPEPVRVELRQLWRERIERLWRQCVIDVAQQKPGAVTAGVRVAQAAAMLDGLNEPTTVETRVHQRFEAVVLELRAEGLA